MINENLNFAILQIVKTLNLQTEDNDVFCKKVANKMMEEFSGYNTDFSKIFSKKIPNIHSSSSLVSIKDIHFLSHCLHHMTPIVGTVTINYIPTKWLLGFSKVIDCINGFTKRLQLQENLTIEIANCISKNLETSYIKVEISARHYCMQKSQNELPPIVETVFEI